MLDADEDVPRGRHEDAGCRRGRHEDVPLLAAVALLSAMHGSAHADSPPRTRPDATEPTTTVHQSVAAFEEAVYSGCGLPSLKSVTLLLDAVLLEAPAGIDGQTRLVGTMRILARALRQVYLLRGGEEGCVGGPALLCSSNWRLFLLASVLLASKFAEDDHVELVELHKIAALGLPVGVHMPSCGQIASAEIALLRLLEWHAGFNGGELSRQRMHLARLAEQVVGEAEVLTPADCAFLQSRHSCQELLPSRWFNAVHAAQQRVPQPHQIPQVQQVQQEQRVPQVPLALVQRLQLQPQRLHEPQTQWVTSQAQRSRLIPALCGAGGVGGVSKLSLPPSGVVRTKWSFSPGHAPGA